MIRIETQIESLSQIISALMGYSDKFSFVIREDNDYSKPTTELLDKLSGYLIEKSEVSEWPGTKLLVDRAWIYYFHLNEESGKILSNTCDNLYRWISPNLPEDIIIYKKDRPIFVSIAHERETF